MIKFSFNKLALIALAFSLVIGAVATVTAIGGGPSAEKIWIATGIGPNPGPSDHLTIDTGKSGNTVTSVEVKRNGVWESLSFSVESGGDPVEIDISPEAITGGENVRVKGSNAHKDVEQNPSIDFS